MGYRAVSAFGLLSFVSAVSVAGCSATVAKPGDAAPPPAGTTPGAATTEPTPEPPNVVAEEVDRILSKAAASDAFSGSAIVVDGGKTVLVKGYGLRDRSGESANAGDTIFRVGSISKQFTASAVLALAAEGKLAVTDPLSKWFPSYPKENLSKDGEEVTLHHLLTHTSGLGDARGTKFFSQTAWRRPITPDEVIAEGQLLPMVAKPGTAYAYLNYGYLLLARIVEKASGKSYEAFLQDRFFTPLEMNDTGTILPEAKKTRAAIGYERSADGQTFTSFADDPSFRDVDVTLSFGSGQIYSTVLDLAKWDRALVTEQALGAAQKAMLFQPFLAEYAYGWVVEKKSGIDVQWHNGALAPLSFTSFMMRIPSKDRFVAYLSNFDLDTISPFEKRITTAALK